MALFGREFGSKTGSGPMMSASEANVNRRERLRQLALETVDLQNDPYLMKNHLGSYDCKLCGTLHTTEGSYLAHTQGKRHQQNLGRRAAKLAKEQGAAAPLVEKKRIEPRHIEKIGRPGYKVVKQRDPATGQRSLLFQVSYPQAEEGLQPRHRFMSAFEQRVERPNNKFQYLLFACAPYETIAFKIPCTSIDRSEGKFFTNWDPDRMVFTLQLFFTLDQDDKGHPQTMQA